jgi:hypothetical protein
MRFLVSRLWWDFSNCSAVGCDGFSVPVSFTHGIQLPVPKPAMELNEASARYAAGEATHGSLRMGFLSGSS